MIPVITSNSIHSLLSNPSIPYWVTQDHGLLGDAAKLSSVGTLPKSSEPWDTLGERPRYGYSIPKLWTFLDGDNIYIYIYVCYMIIYVI